LAHVTIVVGCLFYRHLRLLELLADLRRPLGSLSDGAWELVSRRILTRAST
jgi:hypothetical protein